MAGTPCSSCLRACARFERAPRCFFAGEACVDGREASAAGSAVEVLKASGPPGTRRCHSPPVLVTYGPAMLSTPRLLV